MIDVYTWGEIRNTVAQFHPELVKRIDHISPSDSYKIYKVRYPFGATILDNSVLHVPLPTGEVVSIDDPRVDKQIRHDLFRARIIPWGIVLNRSIELYQIIGSRIVPFMKMESGHIFGIAVLKRDQTAHYIKLLWNISAGGHSIQVLPKISCQRYFDKVKQHYQLSCEMPKDPSEHWQMIKELANHSAFPEPWYVEVLFFTEDWTEKLSDIAWSPLSDYLFRLLSNQFMHVRLANVYNNELSNALKNYRLKANPYLLDIAEHLYHMAFFKTYPGLAFAKDSNALPLQGLQTVLNDIYRLEYTPTILCLEYFNGKDNNTLYYSLQFSTLLTNTPNSTASLSKRSTLIELKTLMDRTYSKVYRYFKDEATFAKAINQNVTFDFLHTHPSLDGLLLVDDIEKQDSTIINEVKKFGKPFAKTSPFLRGCVRLMPQILDKK